jgi:hypothetical protein
MSDRGSPIPAPRSSHLNSSRQRARPVQIASDEDVLQAVLLLWNRYHAPSTSLIVSHLANGNPISPRLQNTVRDALQRLTADDRLACVIHRGTQHWSPRQRSKFP